MLVVVAYWLNSVYLKHITYTAMKNLNLCLAACFCLILIQSCKKEAEVTLPPDTGKPQIAAFKDSISFTVDETKYVFNDRYSAASGNHPVNIRKSDVKIPGWKLANETGGFYFYGAPDSTLYAAKYEVASKDWEQRFKIFFTKKYKNSELEQKPVILYPKSHDDLFKVGMPGFAVDLNKENSTEGVAIELFDVSTGVTLMSMMPGFSILVRPDLKKDIQDDSNFTVTKVEKTADAYYIIEAKFELNLFDKDGKLYRAKNGFLRLKAPLQYN